MAYPNHLSQEMDMQHYSDENSAVLRSTLQEQSSPDVKPLEHHQPPTWLNSASQYTDAGAGENLQSNSAAAPNQWLLQRNVSDVQASNDSDLNKDDSGNNIEKGKFDETEVVNWQNAGYKAEILAHPLFEQLLSAHVACLRIATPVDQLPRIDAQLAQSQQVVGKYSGLGHGNLADDKELDQFLVSFFFFFSFYFTT